MSVGEKITQLFEEAKRAGQPVRQEDVAQAVGVRQSHISRIVRGEIANPRIELLQSICDYFSEKLGRPVTLDELVQRDPQKRVLKAEKGLKIEEMADRLGVKIRVLDPETDFVRVPEYGNVPCGNLERIEASDIKEWHVLPRNMGANERTFLLRAVGDSMEPEIREGAYLLVEPVHKYEDGDIVVAWVNTPRDAGVTCKRLHYTDEHALLVANNPNYPPLVVSGDTRIFGRVETYFYRRNHRKTEP